MLDITIDFETCALCPTAAVMSVGAVAWNRHNIESPFFTVSKDSNKLDADCVFSAHVDLRSMFVDGFTFDADTAKWWSMQSEKAKEAVLEWDSEEGSCFTIEAVIRHFIEWVDDVKMATGETDVCLWSQGSDFDIAILRNICYKYGIKVPVCYKNFRDHRTFFMEGAHVICDLAGVDFDPKRAYTLVDELEDECVAHDPVSDCKRSIYSTWQMMRHLHCFRRDEARDVVGKALDKQE